MEEPLEQERSMTSDELKPSSSSTASKSTKSNKQTSNGKKSRHKRRRPAHSARSSSDHSTSSSRSSSTSSTHSSHSSVKPCPSIEQQPKKTRSVLAQEYLQTIVDKTKTGHIDIIDSFSFLSFDIDDDWQIAYDHFKQQQNQKTLTNKKPSHLSSRKNGSVLDHHDASTLHRSVSTTCKVDDGQRKQTIPTSVAVEDTKVDINRESMWLNRSPTKNSTEHQSSTSNKSESTDRTHRLNRTTSEHDDHQNNQHDRSTTPRTNGSSQKSNDDKADNHDRKHHVHSHHQHKAHKRHKTNHDLSINGDSSNKHSTITSTPDFTKQQIKKEPLSLTPTFPFSNHFDPKLFPMPPFPPFATPAAPHSLPNPYSHPYDPSLMLSGRLYGGPYPRDLPHMPPASMQSSRPPSRSLTHPYAMKDNHAESATSMEKMFEKFYPGVLPGYLAAAASAAAAASVSTNSNSSVASLNLKMHGASANGPDHSHWSQRETYQRQFMNSSGKPDSTKSAIFDNNSKLPPNHQNQSPVDRRHSSSHSTNDLPSATSTPSGHPLYLAPVIFAEYHQHQHNHNHTHEHKLNITTKEERQTSMSPSRSRTPSSSEAKKMKTSFSVTDIVVDKSVTVKNSPKSQQPQTQGFHSVNNKKESVTSNGAPLSNIKMFNGKWSTAHIQVAQMINEQEQRQREKSNSLHSVGKVRPTPGPLPLGALPLSSQSSASTLLPPPLPLNDNTTSDLGLLRPPPLGLPFDMNLPQHNIFRPPSTATMKLPRPIMTSTSSSSLSSSSAGMKPPSIKREQKTPFPDDRMRRSSPPPPSLSIPLSRSSSSSSSNFLPSPHRSRMDFPPLVLPPPGLSSAIGSGAPTPMPSHPLGPFSSNDDRKRFSAANPDLLNPFGSVPGTSPFLSPLFAMGAPMIPSLPLGNPSFSLSSSSMARRNGSVHALPNSDSSKTMLFPPGPGPNPFDFGRPPLLPPGSFPMSNNPFETDRYRLAFEQQARDRDLQLAFMTAAAGGNSQAPGSMPPPPLFTDPTSSPLFKPY